MCLPGPPLWPSGYCIRLDSDRTGVQILIWSSVCIVTGHWSLSAVMHAPFHASVLRPASQVGQMHKAAGMGKLVNAALLSLINETCVSVCCATLLLSQLIGPACVQAQSSNLRGRACGPSG